jgi:phage tail sheath protein FI
LGTSETKKINDDWLIEGNGLEGLKHIDEISIVCAPDDSIDGVYKALIQHCEDPSVQGRFAILQSQPEQTPTNLLAIRPAQIDSANAAFYFPWLQILDPLTHTEMLIPPGGHVAGIYARSDSEQGVHRAPANERVRGALSVQLTINTRQQEILNPIGVNVIRSFPGKGILLWGARTLSTDPQWKYISVRRLVLFLEKSIKQGTQWAVFEPNNEQLWNRINQQISAFLLTLWRIDAFRGTTPSDAFFVKIDRSTMTQDDIDNGRLIVLIGIAPVKPAEFVIFRIGLWTDKK